MSDLPQYDFVIVGAGFAGAATAFHLRRAGVERIVVLEREAGADRHSSGRNAAIVREDMSAAVLQPLARESAAMLRSGTLAPFRACGGLHMNEGEEDVSRRVPIATGRARFAPRDGVVDISALQRAYLDGVPVRYGCALDGFEATDSEVRIETRAGSLTTGVLVNATGAWAGAIGALPLTPTNRHLFMTEPMPTVDPAWPFVWDGEAGYYFRPESGGLLLSACDETPAEPGAYRVDPAVLETLAEKLARHQPGLSDLRIARTWVGQRTFAADRLPALGFDPRQPRVYHVAGLGGHGVTLSYAVGRHAAEELLARSRAPSAFDPARLGDTKAIG